MEQQQIIEDTVKKLFANYLSTQADFIVAESIKPPPVYEKHLREPEVVPLREIPVEKYATHYNTDHPKRGLAIIFNHQFFDNQRLKQRKGTDTDCENFQRCLENLNFEVRTFNDLTYTQIGEELVKVAQEDHNDNDCLLITVFSHGEQQEIIYSKDTPYTHNYLWDPFTPNLCPSLAGKPKIFILQACQGGKVDDGWTMCTPQTNTPIKEKYKIPLHADFLFLYSTIKDYGSWRHPVHGSPFISALSKVWTEKAFEMDLVSTFTYVSQKVAVDFESWVPNNSSWDKKRQIPCIMSTLIRFIQLKSKNSNTLIENSSG